MANPDINTPPDFIQAYPLFSNLLGNKAIQTAFAVQEKRAQRWKLAYTVLGIVGLAAAFATFTAVIGIVTLEHFFYEGPKLSAPSEARWFKRLFFGVGLAGFFSQMILLISPIKRFWLDARFHAERLRCIKFQAFQAAACGGDQAVEEFTRRALGELSIDMANASAARHHFRTEAALIEVEAAPCATGENLRQLRDAYWKLRIDRQAAFATGEIHRIEAERKLPASSSEVAFWIGATLAFIDAAIIFFQVAWEPLRPLMHFVVLEVFIISALLFVLEEGRSYKQALERYEEYRDQMLSLADRLDRAATAEEFQACVREGELHALKELRTFCREAQRSTYLI